MDTGPSVRFRSFLLVLLIAVGLALTGIPAAHALPSETPDVTFMVDAPVRAMAQVSGAGGNLLWIAGSFTAVLDATGRARAAVSTLAALDASGAIAVGVHVPLVTGVKPPIVYDLSLSPDGGALYLAGRFTAVDGQPRKNVAAIDPLTGALLPFHPLSLPASSVLATADAVLVGGIMLASYRPDGTPTPGFTPPVAVVDLSLRLNEIKPTFRDLALVGSTIVSACQCDAVIDRYGQAETRAVVTIDALTGDLLPWVPSNLQEDSGAFGEHVVLAEDPVSSLPTVYLAAGGSDFTAAYDLATGAQLWKTDTSGSSQALALYQDRLVVGGHFEWVESPAAAQCGKNTLPDPACYHAPRLVALDRASGGVILDPVTSQPWNPGICCNYNGVWSLLTDADGASLHVGGEFRFVGGTWAPDDLGVWRLLGYAKHRYYARLTDAPPLAA